MCLQLKPKTFIFMDWLAYWRGQYGCHLLMLKGSMAYHLQFACIHLLVVPTYENIIKIVSPVKELLLHIRVDVNATFSRVTKIWLVFVKISAASACRNTLGGITHKTTQQVASVFCKYLSGFFLTKKLDSCSVTRSSPNISKSGPKSNHNICQAFFSPKS